MPNLSFDLLRLITAYLSPTEVINFLCVKRSLAQELTKDSFWQSYYHLRAPTLVSSIINTKQKHTSWKDICLSDTFHARLIYKNTFHRKIFNYRIPITHHEDMIMRLVSGAVFIYFPSHRDRIQLFCKPDKVIFSSIVDDKVRLTYISEGYLYWYCTLINHPTCYNNYIVSRDVTIDLTNSLAPKGNVTAAVMKSSNGFSHVVQVRERTEIFYLTFSKPKPCETSNRLHITEEKKLDITVPAPITSIALSANGSHLSIFIVTSAQWLYQYGLDQEVWLISKEPNIMMVANYERSIMCLDNQGHIKQLLSFIPISSGWILPYIQHNGNIYLQKKRNLYTLRNFISSKLHRCHQSVQLTTLIESEERAQKLTK